MRAHPSYALRCRCLQPLKLVSGALAHGQAVQRVGAVLQPAAAGRSGELWALIAEMQLVAEWLGTRALELRARVGAVLQLVAEWLTRALELRARVGGVLQLAAEWLGTRASLAL
eukprot:5636148-Alexandrium_andersonii.AAC.1